MEDFGVMKMLAYTAVCAKARRSYCRGKGEAERSAQAQGGVLANCHRCCMLPYRTGYMPNTTLLLTRRATVEVWHSPQSSHE